MLFPIDWNTVQETGTSKHSVLCKLFLEQQKKIRQENLLFPIFCSGNRRGAYLSQFRGWGVPVNPKYHRVQ